MHHMSFVRQDIASKLVNVSNRGNLQGKGLRCCTVGSASQGLRCGDVCSVHGRCGAILPTIHSLAARGPNYPSPFLLQGTCLLPLALWTIRLTRATVCYPQELFKTCRVRFNVFGIEVGTQPNGAVIVGRVGAEIAARVGSTSAQSKPQAARANTATCSVCGKRGKLRCGACRQVTYCSPACQKVGSAALVVQLMSVIAAAHSCCVVYACRRIGSSIRRHAEVGRKSKVCDACAGTKATSVGATHSSELSRMSCFRLHTLATVWKHHH